MSYYELFQMGPMVYIPVLLVSLVVTVVAYGLFPILFAIFRKKNITKKKNTWICYGVNFVVMVVFLALNGSSSGAPYLLWTWVFTRYGVKKIRLNGYLSDGEYLEDDSNRITECLSCGYRDEDYFDTCPQCGHQKKRYVYLNRITECLSCGYRDEDYFDTCPQCGHQAKRYVDLAEESSAGSDPVRFCRNCGEELVNGSKFCSKCGTEVSAE